MKILIGSSLFPPSCGGMETVMSLLAEQFAGLGHEVKVVTETAIDAQPGGYEVLSSRGSFRREELRWCDVVVQSCMSLRQIVPLLSGSKPMLVIHHTWYRRPNGHTSKRDMLKRFFCRFAENVAVSEAIAKHLPVPAEVIGNPYNDEVFNVANRSQADIDIAFAGRLVSDKGVDTLLEALVLLRKAHGLKPRTVIVGGGPEEHALKALARERDLAEYVEFLGQQTAVGLAATLRRSRTLAVPSRWEEPFGVVALEAIACGCYCVGSDGGGLPEAIGKCGTLFPRNDAHALAECLHRVLTREHELLSPDETAEHLRRHRKRSVAETYVAKLKGLLT